MLGVNDVVQEVFIQVFRSLPNFRGESRFTTWLHRVTVNEQIHHLGGDYRTEARALNDEIRRLAARRLNTTVIDWNQMVLDHAADDRGRHRVAHRRPRGDARYAPHPAQAARPNRLIPNDLRPGRTRRACPFALTYADGVAL